MLKAELTNMMKLKISRKRTECRDYGNLPKVCRKPNSGKKDKSKCESKSKYEESNYITINEHFLKGFVKMHKNNQANICKRADLSPPLAA